jgi:hypothetical protein
MSDYTRKQRAKPAKLRDVVVRPPERHAKLQTQDPPVVEHELFFHSLVWDRHDSARTRKLVACIPVTRIDEFLASERIRAGFDASLVLHREYTSEAKDPRRGFTCKEWLCTASARREKSRQARQEGGVTAVILDRQAKKQLNADNKLMGSEAVALPRVSNSLLGMACSSVACAYSLTIKVYICDATRAYVELMNGGKHCQKGCEEHQGENVSCHGHAERFCPARCSPETKELCKSLLNAHVPNMQIIERTQYHRVAAVYVLFCSANSFVETGFMQEWKSISHSSVDLAAFPSLIVGQHSSRDLAWEIYAL